MSKFVFAVISWYAYQSIRIDLVSISRPVLDRNPEKQNKKIIVIIVFGLFFKNSFIPHSRYFPIFSSIDRSPHPTLVT